MRGKKSIEAEVAAIAAAFDGTAIEEPALPKQKAKRPKAKPVVCEAAYIGDLAEWDYKERTYDLLLEFGIVPLTNI